MGKFAVALAVMATLSASATMCHADWTVSHPDSGIAGHNDLMVESPLLSARIAAKGGNITSLLDKTRQFENAKLFPNGNNDGLAQIRLSGLSSTLGDGIYNLETQQLAGGSLRVTATTDIPITDNDATGSLRLRYQYDFDGEATRVKISTHIENQTDREVNMVPWLKQLLFRGHGTAFEDMARVSFLTPYGVWDSNKPIPGRGGIRYGNMTDVHYLTASNWMSRTLQPNGPAANTLTMVVEPARMFKVYTWRKSSEDMMTEEVILAPKTVVKAAADDFAYYLTITPALDAPAYASPLLNIEVDPHPLGLSSSAKEITLRMAAVRGLGEVTASGALKRLDATEETQTVHAVFANVNEKSTSQAVIPVNLAPRGRYRLELHLTTAGKELKPGAEIGDNDPVVIPLIVDDEVPTAISYPSRVAGENLFPKRAPRRVAAPLVLDKNGLKIFRLPTTQRAFETDTFNPQSRKREKVELFAAANEYQSLQLALASSGKETSTFKVSATPLSGPSGATIPVEHLNRFLYAQTKVPSRYSPKYPLANYPDGLLPTDSIEVKPGAPAPLFITYKTPQGAPAGDYTGEVTIGEVKVPVVMHVWRFELPVRPAIDMVSATRQGNKLDPMYFQYKITPANLPVSGDLLAGNWDAVKKQMPVLIAQGMSRTYLGSVSQLLAKPGPERIREVETFLKENGWLDYFYVRPGFDEASPGKLPMMIEQLRQWKAVSSIATMENYYYDTGVEDLYGLMDIYSRYTVSPWMKERAKKGDHFWRVNTMPSALESDLPELWATYLRMVDDNFSGSYLWTVSAWLEMEWGVDWWADPGVGNLEATLIWKHPSGYLPSIRLEAMRDAIEGFTTYKMLKDRVAHPRPGDDPKVLKQARTLCESEAWRQIKTDADVERIRNELGAALSALN